MKHAYMRIMAPQLINRNYTGLQSYSYETNASSVSDTPFDAMKIANFSIIFNIVRSQLSSFFYAVDGQTNKRII